MNVVNYSNITTIPVKGTGSKFTGSGTWKFHNNVLYRKTSNSSIWEIKGNLYNNYLQTLNYCDILGIPPSERSVEKAGKKIANYAIYISRYRELLNAMNATSTRPPKTYKINKSKVRKRIISLCRLNQSKNFLAFYSISFPLKAPDVTIYEIFNKWLTNCRTRYGLTTYVWVAERQKNGTLHFHILTNSRMDISKVNRAMANSINTSVLQGKLTWGQSSITLYNGVDVDSIQHPKRRQNENRDQYRRRLREQKKHTIRERVNFAVKYMTKYMTKSDEVFTHLPFHCSRDISQLFTTIVLSDQDFQQYLKYVSDLPEDYIIYESEKRTTYVFREIPADMLFNMLDRLNNFLYEAYNNKNSPP